MADDVSDIISSYANLADIVIHSPEPFWQLLFKMKISHPAMMEHQQTAVVPTRMTKV